MNQLFRANGKLLISGEYLVLKGALALAVPLAKGQTMQVEEQDLNGVRWQAFIPKGKWFEVIFSRDLQILTTTHKEYAQRLQQILQAVLQLNGKAIKILNGKSVTTSLEFNPQWGWGSSSTLISLLSQWLDVDAWHLNSLTFGGSGYDLACAVSSQPLIYQITDQTHQTKPVYFNPPFMHNIGVVWLNRKQSSAQQVKAFLGKTFNDAGAINEISEIGKAMISCDNQNDFNQLINRHETIIASITGLTPVQNELFQDFGGSIKSLGAWGGDYILFSSYEPFLQSAEYFQTKGYTTLFNLKEIVLNKTKILS